ncbi:MAG: pyridoxal phosphate-dependent aminotransferase [Fimbriimonadaceae bacterium]|nr:pyridoxal phosphate-dependent aminotransferase [Fimbriimonadaceae bacterium]
MKTLALAERTRLLKPSPTLAIASRAKELKAEGKDVLSLSVGEPDFNTPDSICEAAVRALQDGHTKYAPSSGIPALRQAVAKKMSEGGLPTESNQVVISCGAKHALYETLQVLVNPGDEVILIAPYWMTYADQIELAGGRPVVCSTRAEDDFAPEVDAVRDLITDRTKAIILNSPCNPTGAVFPRETLQAIATLATERGVWIISDEIYEDLIYEGKATRVAALDPAFAANTITISGFSKSYAMTGWRLGYSVSPFPVAKALSNLQDQVTSNATSFAQYGALAAMDLPVQELDAMRASFLARRNQILDGLRSIEGIQVRTPHGAFYAFPDVSAFLRDGEDDVTLASRLLEEAYVAVVPGSVFQGFGHLRLSYATSPAELEKAVQRLGDCLARRS